MLVGVGSLAVKVVATGKELTLAAMFGRGDLVDALLIAMLAPMFVVGVVSSSLNAALVPTFVQVRDQQGRDAAQRLFSNAIVWSQGLFLACTGLLATTGPWLLPLLGSGFSPAKLALTLRLFYALLPVIAINGLVTTWASIINANERFWLPALTPVLTPLMAVLLLIMLGVRWGVWPLVIGILIGSVTEALVLALVLHRQGISLRPRWYGADEAFRQVQRQWAPVLAGGFLASGVGCVDQAMAAMLPSGSVSALSYASRIVSVGLTMMGSSISTAVIPFFSRMVANSDFQGCRHTLSTYTRLIAATTLPLTGILIVFSRPIVHLLYQRGSFGVEDATLVAHIQALYAIQIPFFVTCQIHVRLLSALQRNDLVFCAAGINLVLDVIFNLVFMRWWGVAGIALSTSLFFVVTCAFVVFAGRRVLAARSGASCASAALIALQPAPQLSSHD